MILFAPCSLSVLPPKLLLGQQAANPAPPPPAPVPWQLGLNSKTPIPHVEVAEQVAAAELRFFSPQQMATLTRLSDILMPPIGMKPGAVLASDADLSGFLDWKLSGRAQTGLHRWSAMAGCAGEKEIQR